MRAETICATDRGYFSGNVTEIEGKKQAAVRRQEAIRLTAANIDFKKRLLHIARTKSKRVRIIPLNETAFQMIESLGPELFSHLDTEMASRSFGKYVRRAGMTGFRMHSSRHTFATNSISRGVDIYSVSRLLGHSDIPTTMIYAKSNVELLQTAVMKLNGM